MAADMNPAYASQEYLRTKLETASPLEAVVMMYELAIDSLNAAVAQLRSGDAMARAKSVTKAQEVVNELLMAVDHSSGASYTATLVELYGYVQSQIIKGHTEQSETAFQNAISILRSLWEGWSEVQRQTAAESTVEAAPRTGSGYGSDPAAFESRDWTC